MARSKEENSRQQLAGAQRLGARERRDGVQGVEQEVRVDLRLQGAQLRPGGELVLQLELVDGELRGQQLGEAGGERVLRAVHVMAAPVVELEGPHCLVAHLERDDDARRDRPVLGALAAHVDHVREGLGDPVVEHVARGGRVDGGSGREVDLELAHAGEHVLLVGHGDRHGARLGQQAPADRLRALAVEAGLDDVEHLGRRRQRLLGVLGTQRVGVQAQVDEGDEEHEQQRAGDHRRRRVEALGERVHAVADEAERADDGEQAEPRQGPGARHDAAAQVLQFSRHVASSNISDSSSSFHRPSMMLGQKLWNRMYLDLFSSA